MDMKTKASFEKIDWGNRDLEISAERFALLKRHLKALALVAEKWEVETIFAFKDWTTALAGKFPEAVTIPDETETALSQLGVNTTEKLVLRNSVVWTRIPETEKEGLENPFTPLEEFFSSGGVLVVERNMFAFPDGMVPIGTIQKYL